MLLATIKVRWDGGIQAMVSFEQSHPQGGGIAIIPPPLLLHTISTHNFLTHLYTGDVLKMRCKFLSTDHRETPCIQSQNASS